LEGGNKQKSLEYWQKAGELYARAGVSPLFIAGQFRRLTTSEVLTLGDSERMVRLNDLTNQYLALGDASAKKAMLPSETLKLLEEERRAVAPAVAKAGTEPPSTADQILDRYVQAERALRSGRVVKPIPFDWSTAREAASNLADPAETCARTDPGSGNFEMNTAVMKSQANLDFSLAYSSANAFASTSITQYVCGPSPTAQQVPGYEWMSRWKGMFTELVSPRKLTVLPGYSKERTEALEALPDAMLKFKARIAALPPDQQQELKNLKNLPQDAREKSPAYMALKEYTEAVTKTGHLLTNPDPSEVNPLGFLELLKPEEAFVDVYKYRVHQGDHFGAKHYLAVISANATSSRLIQLGPAEPIDAAIDSFFYELNGGSDLAPTWKALQRLVVQPVLAALPPGTRRMWLSPDSSFALVPFASLMVDLRVPVTVSVIPSAYDFARLRPAAAAPGAGRALLVGALDYGKGGGNFKQLDSEGEVREVAKLTTGARLQIITLSGSQATRAAIMNQIQDTQFVHLATHGFWSTSISSTVTGAFRSGGVALSLANSGSADSLLTSEDILHLNLSGVQLVTLSACNSGQGNATDGQGLMGFQTAFMAAGARSLLLSLWKVPDGATSAFMQEFYRGLWKSGLTKAEALRGAQNKLRANPDFADQRNWAAWVLLGEAW
jgi:hypothetical protein